jgi:hypothetical protein
MGYFLCSIALMMLYALCCTYNLVYPFHGAEVPLVSAYRRL